MSGLTQKQILENRIQAVLKKGKLHQNVQQASAILVRAIMQARQYRAKPYYHYACKLKNRRSYGVGKVTGRKDQRLLRWYVFAEAHRAWKLLTPKKPTMPRRHGLPTPFMRYLEGLLIPEHFARLLDNWQEYKGLIEPVRAAYHFAHNR